MVPAGTAQPAGVPAAVFTAAAAAYAAVAAWTCSRWPASSASPAPLCTGAPGTASSLLDEVIWWRARGLLTEQVRSTSGAEAASRGSSP